jgi:phosphopantothenoylcysteine decarboxylase/phosphopantothenate--cysteine ligase
MSALAERTIVLGVTGGIAAYKAAELIRRLVSLGARVHVIMTRHACEFITPLTLQTVSGNPVVTGMFDLYAEHEIGHIALAERAAMLLIAPATAGCIGKIAGGIADDMLSTVVMATKAPVLIAPAMNVNMWENPVVQRNIADLKTRGYHFVDPGSGDLACGVQGTGRLADIDDIIEGALTALSPGDFAGTHVLITAGPTREYLDPVRFLSNPSTGKMGFALARTLCRRGASVTLISGPVSLSPPRQATYVPVVSAREMAEAVERCFADADIVIKTAAVGDYRPRQAAYHKLKKSTAPLTLELEPTEDILASLGARKGRRILIGFAAETTELVQHARDKCLRKNLDLIVANDVSRPDAGFAADTNRALLISPDGSVDELPLMSKDDLAGRICDRLAEMLRRS